MSDFLFVYGTLIKQSNLEIASYLERNSTIITEGSFPGKLFDIGNYPGAVFIPESKTKVYGLILHVHNPLETFKKLDEYEETGIEFQQPNEYIRKIIPIEKADGEIIKCWTYLYNHPIQTKKNIPSGKYFDK